MAAGPEVKQRLHAVPIPGTVPAMTAKTKTGAPLSVNIFSNLGGYAVSAAIAFLLSPVIIHGLGDARYGVWSLVADLIGYYGMLDAGIGGAVSHYVARYLGKADNHGVRETLSTALGALTVMGLVVIMIGCGLIYAFPMVFDTRGVNLTEIRIALTIMTLAIGLSFPMAIFNSSLVGHRRMDIVNINEVTIRILVAAASWILIKHGAGMVGLAVAVASGRILSWVACIVWSKRVGAPFPSLHFFRRWHLRELVSYGGKNALINIAILINYRTDSFVIGIFLGVKWITFFTIGSSLVQYCSDGIMAVTRAFTPHLTHEDSRGDRAELKRLYLLGVRLAGLLVTSATAYLLVFGKDFIRLWLGEAYVTGPLTYRSDVVMMVLLGASFPRLLQSISWQLLLATRNQRYLMTLIIGEAVVNLGLSVLLVRRYGLLGVALGTMIPVVISQAALLPAYVLRTYQISIADYGIRGLGRPFLCGGAIFILTKWMVIVYPPASWSIFFPQVAIAALLGVSVIAAFGLTNEERLKIWRLGGLVVSGARA